MGDWLKFILGTVQLGLQYGVNNKVGKPSLQTSLDLLRQARNLGVASLDTSDLYGSSPEVICQFGAAEFKVLSKFSLENKAQFVNVLDTSLSRLGASHLHCYSFHRFSDFENFKDWEAVKKAKEEKKIELVGVSVYSNEQLRRAAEESHIDVIQSPFNLLDNYRLRGEFFEIAKHNKKQIHVRSIYLQGLMLMRPEDLAGATAKLRPAIQKLREIAKKSGLSMQQLCFSYVNSFSNIDAVVVGVETAEQLEQSFELSECPELDSSVLSEIHSIDLQDTEILNPSTWSRT